MDETFHLTALDVRRYDFGKAMRGYSPERVEQFREQVAEELERLTRQLQELDSKAKGFHEQLRAFRERDKALNDALVSAQQLRSEIREASEREAELVIREARLEGERLLDATRDELHHLEVHLLELQRARRAHIAQLRLMAERQLAEVAAAEQMPAGPLMSAPLSATPALAAPPSTPATEDAGPSPTIARPSTKKAHG
jgi:DivIVA domain-containing protein